MRTWMRGFKELPGTLKDCYKVLKVIQAQGLDDISELKNVAGRVVELQDQIEAAQGVLHESLSQISESLNAFVSLNSELIKLMAKYFQYEIKAIEDARKEISREKLEPTPDDYRY